MDAADQADRRVRRVGEEVLVVVAEEGAEAHDQAPADGVRVSILIPVNHLSRNDVCGRNRGSEYQQFAIPQKPDKRAAYGRQERGHLEVGETVLGWMMVFKSDDIMLPGQYAFRFCLELTHGNPAAHILGGLNVLEISWAGNGVRRLGDFGNDCELEIFNKKIGVSE